MEKQQGKRGGRKPMRREKPEFEQKMLNLARVTRVVKGGRRFRFRATLVIGNRKGKVGVGVAKGADVSDAIQKAFNDAKKSMVSITLVNGTIAHDVIAKYGSAKVMLKPGKAGRGLIAGGAVRAVSDLLGVRDIVSKSLGSSNALNLARATVDAFLSLKNNVSAPVAAVAAPVAAKIEAPKNVEAKVAEMPAKEVK
jgi:small subunit ribosomal protein S5